MEMDLIDEFVRKKNGKATYKSWLNTIFDSIGYVKKVGTEISFSLPV